MNPAGTGTRAVKSGRNRNHFQNPAGTGIKQNPAGTGILATTLAKERLIQEMTTANTATEEVKGNETPRTTFDTAWDAVLNEGGESDGSQSEEADQLYRKQLNDYLKEKRVQDLSSDPLKYWQKKHVQYPWLANMVRKYHSPPPGSASAERLFSSAKNVLGQTCLAMKPENMEQNLFLKYGLRACGYGRLSDVPKDFVAPNVKPVSKPIVADSVDEDIDVEVDISSDESENED